MSASFELDHRLLAGDPRFASMAAELRQRTRINSSETFNDYCWTACRLWRAYFPAPLRGTSDLFEELMEKIEARAAGTISTSWGGVVVTRHKHPLVEKFLVIREGGYLALETHAQKDESLEVREGAGLMLSRMTADQPLLAQGLTPGGEFHFEPGMEHCLIGTDDLLVFERSTDPKGMDQDLIFFYEPDGKPA